MTVSAVKQHGLNIAWDEMRALVRWRRDNGHWDQRRAEQAQYWFGQEVRQSLLAQLETDDARATLISIAKQVADGTLTPNAAAKMALARLAAS